MSRLGFFGSWSAPASRISNGTIAYMEIDHTVECKDVVFMGNTCIGDYVVYFARG
jgi:hypothetical protein